MVGLTWTASFAVGALVDPEGPGQVVALALAVPALVSPLSVLLTRRRRGLSLLVAGAELADARGYTLKRNSTTSPSRMT